MKLYLIQWDINNNYTDTYNMLSYKKIEIKDLSEYEYNRMLTYGACKRTESLYIYNINYDWKITKSKYYPVLETLDMIKKAEIDNKINLIL